MFRKAQRKKAKLRLGLAGPAGSGKTYSALLIAFGLGGKVAMLDTEHGSGELYANLGDYDVATLSPPFSPDRYVKIIREAEKEGYNVLIIDSISHAWAGEGGILEMHDKYAKTKGNSFTAWREVTPTHNALVEAMLQSEMHIIATMRSKQEYIMTTDDKGKTAIKKVGMAPIQRDGMEYEFTLFLELSLEHYAMATKDRTSLFDGRPPFVITVETGKTLLEWLEEGIDPVAESQKAMQVLLERIERIANVFELKNWYKKHASEISALIPAHQKEVISACTKKRAGLEEQAKTA
ncbi:MAG: AAA family ATPase [Deltaproteobacteria bacterium]|nr:MAG: AAA family ATPase [Deltaproteobacteria bacterium]